MSESQAPTTDTQSILQSMLQRLRLQPGTETQGPLHLSRPATAALSHGQGGGTGTHYLQTAGGLNNIPVDGLGAAVIGLSHTDDIDTEPGGQGGRGIGNHGDFGQLCEMRRSDSRKAFGTPLCDFGKPATTLRGRGPQLGQLDQGQEVTTFSSSPLGVISSPSLKNNIVSDRRENSSSGSPQQEVITPKGRGQRFPADTPKDADVTSFERRGDEIIGCIDSENLSTANTHPHDGQSSLHDTSPLTCQSPYQNSRPTTEGTVDSRTVEQSQKVNNSDTAFTPRVYAWSLKPPEAIHSTGSRAEMGNGGSGVLLHSKDTEILSTRQKTTASEVQMNKRPSETKTRRWTQKIKDRWREQRGSLTKRGRERKEVKDERVDEFSPQTPPSVAQNERERPRHSPTRSDLIDTPPDLSQHCTTDAHIRSINDFEFGLGSFSLLEEILTGQEWARFLNPTVNSTNQRPTEQGASQLKTTLNLQHQGGLQLSANQSGSVNQWNFRGMKSGRAPDFSTTPISSDISGPVIMDFSEPSHIPDLDSKNKANQLEPMEHGNIQSDSRSEESVMGLNHTPQRVYSFIKPVDVLDNSATKSRVPLNRKRVHQSQERRGEMEPVEEGERGRKEAKRDEFTSSSSTAINQIMEESERKGDDNAMMSLYPTKSSLYPLSPSFTPPPVPMLRSVLRHSLSQDSESSVTMETSTKKRRVEDSARRVHFSEEVVAIAPIDLDLEGSDIEDSEEDSLTDEDVGMEQAVEEQVVVPPPRATLPAWILALKRRKKGRKPRQ